VVEYPAGNRTVAQASRNGPISSRITPRRRLCQTTSVGGLLVDVPLAHLSTEPGDAPKPVRLPYEFCSLSFCPDRRAGANQHHADRKLILLARLNSTSSGKARSIQSAHRHRDGGAS
jgi:hypothetical protein